MYFYKKIYSLKSPQFIISIKLEIKLQKINIHLIYCLENRLLLNPFLLSVKYVLCGLSVLFN